METYSPIFDKMLGVLLSIALLVGVPANILAIRFFYLYHRTSTSKLIYMIVAITDTFSCFNTFPVIISLFSERKPVLYSDFTFTQIWGITWEPLPYFSVFLVFIMTLIRALMLIKPLIVWNRRLILGIVISYYIFLIVRFSVGLIFFGHYQFMDFSGYAWIQVTVDAYGKVDIFLAVFLLAFPIIPIIALSAISIYKIIVSIKKGNKNKRLADIKRRSSVTVVIFALTYIVFNIPVFFTYLWFILAFHFDHKIIPDHWFQNYYLWIMTYICCVAWNAFCNPLIYCGRMSEFRQHIVSTDAGRRLSRARTARSLTLENLGTYD